jgi:RNA polymerase sigma-70 factor (ECF subfamily)
MTSFPDLPTDRSDTIERLNRKDFEGIYRHYRKPVYSLCLRMTRNEADAQDLMQESFLRLLQKLHTFRGESAFFTWFHRMVVNEFLMQVRRRRRSPITSMEESVGTESQATLPPREAASVDNGLVGMVDRLALREAMGELPIGYRVALELHDVEGYGHGEISEMTERSVSTSKSQLHRARRRLRKLLAPETKRRIPAAPPRVSRIPATPKALEVCAGA